MISRAERRDAVSALGVCRCSVPEGDQEVQLNRCTVSCDFL